MATKDHGKKLRSELAAPFSGIVYYSPSVVDVLVTEVVT